MPDTESCPTCHGAGRTTCGTCAGGGRTTCGMCSGAASRVCSSCGGAAYQMRTDWNGNTAQVACSGCGGSGRIRCSSCSDGRVSCANCMGIGTQTCLTCGGSRAAVGRNNVGSTSPSTPVFVPNQTQVDPVMAFITWDKYKGPFETLERNPGSFDVCAWYMERFSQEIFPCLPSDAPWPMLRQAQQLGASIHARQAQLNSQPNSVDDPEVMQFIPVAKELRDYLNDLMDQPSWASRKRGASGTAAHSGCFCIPIMLAISVLCLLAHSFL